MRAQQFDSEYASLMAELGETSSSAPLAGGNGTPNVGGGAGDNHGAAGGGGAPWNAGGAGNMQGVPLDDKGEKIPPWRLPGNWYVPLVSALFLI